ncbi:HEPN domain-containing protein [Thermococcus sp.]
MHYEEVEFLRKRAKTFWENGEYLMKLEKYDIASFHFEQAVQLELKAILLQYSGERYRTHSIRNLLEAIGETFDEEEKVRGFIRKHRNDIKALEDAYIDTRYEPVVYRDYDAEAVKKTAEMVLEFAGSLVKEDG